MVEWQPLSPRAGGTPGRCCSGRCDCSKRGLGLGGKGNWLMLGSHHYGWLQGHTRHLHLGLVFPSLSSPGDPLGLSLAWEPAVVGLGAIQSPT